MKHLMPLRRVVVEITNEAVPNDLQSNRKALKSWHNRLSNGSIPRSIVTKLGRELFLDIEAWETWLLERDHVEQRHRPGRPRTM
jgi:hypothetical protein